MSTAYVAGRHEGVFLETDLRKDQIFRNPYERTKHEAEILVNASVDELPLVVARPSIVVGEAPSGWTCSFNVLYPPLRAYSRGLLTSAPAAPDGIVDVITGDYAADALLQLLADPRAHGTYHVVAGDQALSVEGLRRLAAETFKRDPSSWFARPTKATRCLRRTSTFAAGSTTAEPTACSVRRESMRRRLPRCSPA